MIIGPLGGPDFSDMDIPDGAGGAGPVGGGGGQGDGGGSREERIAYVKPPSTPSPLPAIAPPTPVPQVPPPLPIPQPKPVEVSKPSVNSSAGTGSQQGTGGNVGGGTGPGSGGGIGSGTGTGRGTSAGPGTGGGNDKSYPPVLSQLFLPPLPAPEKVRPYQGLAWFEVDERGNTRLLNFTPTKDNAYNKRLRDVLNSLKFKPGVGVDGMPVKDTVAIEITL